MIFGQNACVESVVCAESLSVVALLSREIVTFVFWHDSAWFNFQVCVCNFGESNHVENSGFFAVVLLPNETPHLISLGDRPTPLITQITLCRTSSIMSVWVCHLLLPPVSLFVRHIRLLVYVARMQQFWKYSPQIQKLYIEWGNTPSLSPWRYFNFIGWNHICWRFFCIMKKEYQYRSWTLGS